MLGQVKQQIEAVFLQIAADQTDQQLTVTKDKLHAVSVSTSPSPIVLKKPMDRKIQESKKSNEVPEKVVFTEIVFSVQVNQYIEQIQTVELITIRKKNIYTSILNESIKNLRKRCYFDSSRQLLKIMSFNYNLFQYMQEMNKLVDSFNALNQPSGSLGVPEKPYGKKISLKAKKPAAMSCVVCAQNIQGLALICRKCKHGGHLSHLREWFTTSKTCPCCPCECFQLMK